MTRVALYTRVSTEDQVQGFSLSDQIERLRLYAKSKDWAIAAEYVDEGHSGRTTKRPAYARMLHEEATWDTILVLKMDRIHRNSRNFMAMMDHLKRVEKGFVSVTESLDTSTAMGRFVMDTIQRIAQLESEQISERVTSGMTQKAKMGGGSLGAPAPYGYRHESGKLVPIEEEAQIVRAIYEASGEGYGKQAIATCLNDMHKRTRQGKAWTVWSVTRILENEAYRGNIKWSGHLQRDRHEAIIPRTM